eukprot:GFYU01016239.1.p1 GENE.GFYU01016239.1~~GFYU01016239.1.p1  ORF type:complete len:295 (+),score=63.04 GFYU01016239.1:2-886(+)
MLGFSLFLMFLMHSYAANLVNIILTSQTYEVSGISDAVSRGMKICINWSQEPIVARKFPGSADLLVPIFMRADVLTGMDSGVCRVAITSEQNFLAEKVKGRHCDKHMIKEVISVQAYASAVAPRWREHLSYWYVKLRLQGVFEQLLDRYHPDEDKLCGDSTAANKTLSLTPMHLFGAFATLIFFSVLSVLSYAAVYTQRYSASDATNLKNTMMMMNGRDSEDDTTTEERTHLTGPVRRRPSAGGRYKASSDLMEGLEAIIAAEVQKQVSLYTFGGNHDDTTYQGISDMEDCAPL